LLTPALRLDMAFDYTSMASDLALPIVALPVADLPVVALRISSVTFLCYQYCGMWSKTADPGEVGFEGQEVCDDSCHCVSLLRELESGCKGLPFFRIRDVEHDVEFPLRVFDRDAAYGKAIDYLLLG